MSDSITLVSRESHVTFRHWWPIITFCVVNGWPDLLYVSAQFALQPRSFIDLYHVRKLVRRTLAWRTVSMEDAAVDVFQALNVKYPQHNLTHVTVSLATGRHIVTVWE